jgi:flagellar biogenesis protein FliO
MQTVLGLIGFVAYIAAVIALAAAVTWLVVRLTPAKKPKTDTASEA